MTCGSASKAAKVVAFAVYIDEALVKVAFAKLPAAQKARAVLQPGRPLMGFYIRKRFNFGPFRINIPKMLTCGFVGAPHQVTPPIG